MQHQYFDHALEWYIYLVHDVFSFILNQTQCFIVLLYCTLCSQFIFYNNNHQDIHHRFLSLTLMATVRKLY